MFELQCCGNVFHFDDFELLLVYGTVVVLLSSDGEEMFRSNTNKIKISKVVKKC